MTREEFDELLKGCPIEHVFWDNARCYRITSWSKEDKKIWGETIVGEFAQAEITENSFGAYEITPSGPMQAAIFIGANQAIGHIKNAFAGVQL